VPRRDRTTEGSFESDCGAMLQKKRANTTAAGDCTGGGGGEQHSIVLHTERGGRLKETGDKAICKILPPETGYR